MTHYLFARCRSAPMCLASDESVGPAFAHRWCFCELEIRTNSCSLPVPDRPNRPKGATNAGNHGESRGPVFDFKRPKLAKTGPRGANSSGRGDPKPLPSRTQFAAKLGPFFH